jgi:penicillin-binding protein 1A
VSPHVIERVRSADGKTLYARPTQALGRIVDARYVAMMNTMMHETLVSGTARHADLPGWMAAGKTGTSQDYRDAWFIGYTPHLVTGVWLGNDDNSPTRKATGGGLPAEIWSRFMKAGHQGVAPSALPGLMSYTGWAPAPPSNYGGGSQASSANPRAAQSGQGLDTWLLDKLFGRH